MCLPDGSAGNCIEYAGQVRDVIINSESTLVVMYGGL